MPIRIMNVFLEIIRPKNCIMAFIAVWVGCLIAAGTPVFSNLILYTMVSAFVICAAGMIVNDYFDMYVDKINKPKRPLPSGRIDPKTAIFYAVVLFAIGIVLAYLVNAYVFAIAIINAVVAIMYAWRVKRFKFIGNFLVSWLVGSLFIYAGFVIGNVGPMIILALLAILTNTGREIYKDAEDLVGDKSQGVKTFATRFGSRAAMRIGNVFTLAAVLLSYVPYHLGMFSFAYVPVVLVADIIFIIAMLSRSKRAAKFSILAMLVALIAFVAGAL
ncbi:MAG: UbiA family prenyltransferase [Candidatus Aenigmatarchaeota archaeon]